MSETTVVCAECGRGRHDGDIDYSGMQVVFGESLGWYSGDDGEICGDCMTDMMREANGR